MDDFNYGNSGFSNYIYLNSNNPSTSDNTQNYPLLQPSCANTTYPDNLNMPIINAQMPATNGYPDQSDRNQYLPLNNGDHTSAVADFSALQSTENVKSKQSGSSSQSPIESIESMLSQYSQNQLSSESGTSTFVPRKRHKAAHFLSKKNQQMNPIVDFQTLFLNPRQNRTYNTYNQTQQPPSFNPNGELPVSSNGQLPTNTFNSGEFRGHQSIAMDLSKSSPEKSLNIQGMTGELPGQGGLNREGIELFLSGRATQSADFTPGAIQRINPNINLQNSGTLTAPVRSEMNMAPNVYNTATAPNGGGTYYPNFIYPPGCRTNAGFSSGQTASTNGLQMGSNETYLNPGSLTMNLNRPTNESSYDIQNNLSGQSAIPRIFNIPPEGEVGRRVNLRNDYINDQIGIGRTMLSLSEQENRPYSAITPYQQDTNEIEIINEFPRQNPANNQSQNLPGLQDNPLFLSYFRPEATRNDFLNNATPNNTETSRHRRPMPANVGHIPSRPMAPSVHFFYQQPGAHMGRTYPPVYPYNPFGPNSLLQYTSNVCVAPKKQRGRQPNDARKQGAQVQATGERNSAEPPPPKRKRTTFTVYQLQVLEESFRQDPYITKDERAKLAIKLNVQDTQVKVWFQNRRMRERKKNPDALKDKLRGKKQQRIRINTSPGQEIHPETNPETNTESNNRIADSFRSRVPYQESSRCQRQDAPFYEEVRQNPSSYSILNGRQFPANMFGLFVHPNSSQGQLQIIDNGTSRTTLSQECQPVQTAQVARSSCMPNQQPLRRQCQDASHHGCADIRGNHSYDSYLTNGIPPISSNVIPSKGSMNRSQAVELNTPRTMSFGKNNLGQTRQHINRSIEALQRISSAPYQVPTRPQLQKVSPSESTPVRSYNNSYLTSKILSTMNNKPSLSSHISQDCFTGNDSGTSLSIQKSAFERPNNNLHQNLPNQPAPGQYSIPDRINEVFSNGKDLNNHMLSTPLLQNSFGIPNFYTRSTINEENSAPEVIELDSETSFAQPIVKQPPTSHEASVQYSLSSEISDASSIENNGHNQIESTSLLQTNFEPSNQLSSASSNPEITNKVTEKSDDIDAIPPLKFTKEMIDKCNTAIFSAVDSSTHDQVLPSSSPEMETIESTFSSNKLIASTVVSVPDENLNTLNNIVSIMNTPNHEVTPSLVVSNSPSENIDQLCPEKDTTASSVSLNRRSLSSRSSSDSNEINTISESMTYNETFEPRSMVLSTSVEEQDPTNSCIQNLGSKTVAYELTENTTRAPETETYETNLLNDFEATDETTLDARKAMIEAFKNAHRCLHVLYKGNSEEAKQYHKSEESYYQPGQIWNSNSSSLNGANGYSIYGGRVIKKEPEDEYSIRIPNNTFASPAQLQSTSQAQSNLSLPSNTNTESHQSEPLPSNTVNNNMPSTSTYPRPTLPGGYNHIVPTSGGGLFTVQNTDNGNENNSTTTPPTNDFNL